MLWLGKLNRLRSYAHAKDSSSNPDIALGVKSILLQAKVGKARTDPFGQAELNDVSPDDNII